MEHMTGHAETAHHAASPKHGARITHEMLAASCKRRPARGEGTERFLSRITHLHLNGKRITAMEHLEPCTSLQVLYLYDNAISRLENLEFAKHLTHLYLQGNEIERIENLDALPSLAKLFLDGNRISKLEGLHGAHGLEELHLSNQRIAPGTQFSFQDASLMALSDSLFHLDLSNCGVCTIAPLAVLRNLQTLLCGRNHVTSMTDVATVLHGCPTLRELDLQGNPVCHEPKYRDKLIMITQELSMLDGKPIDPQQRSFLLRFAAHKRRRVRSGPALTEAEGVEAADEAQAGVPRAVIRGAAAAPTAARGAGRSQVNCARPRLTRATRSQSAACQGVSLSGHSVLHSDHAPH